MAGARQVLDIARGQLGTRESPAGSNNVKYNTAYYGREVYDGLWGTTFAWCVVFVWWCFQQAGASELFYGGGKTASCRQLLSYHKRQAVTDYQPGDIIFYNFHGKTTAEHVGICESAVGSSIVTIEGNTGVGNDANGGAVMRRTRPLGQIVGAYRPAYEEDDMDIEALTDEQLVRLAERMQAALGAKSVGPALRPELAAAMAAGITDGSSPDAFCTRAQAAVMVARGRKA